MPQSAKTFRVFVSSTFTDMRVERRILQEKVFPKLKALCESKGATFQDVDLRWGVNEEAQLDQKTMDICLGEIARCQRLSPKPNFIVLLGNKYGWQPIPARIPSSEMELIKQKLPEAEMAILSQWYWQDLNAVPPEYVLQPREEEHRSYEHWQPIEEALRAILRRTAAQLPFSEAELVKYFASATHQEILAGALNPPPGVPSSEEHVFAYLRTIRDLPEDLSARNFTDLSGNDVDPYARSQLEELRIELANKLPPDHIHHYEARWDDGCTLDDADAFALRVFDDMQAIIEEQLREIGEVDSLSVEIARHEKFKDQRIEHFTGRQEALSAIRDYLDSDADKPLSIVGSPGAGKTSLMAKAIDEASGRPTVTVFRFIGTTSASSDTVRLLPEVIAEISRKYRVEVNTVLRGAGLDETMLHTLRGLRKVLPAFLNLATAEKPLFMFLDALDQLGRDGAPLVFDWIPKQLPPHVRLVLSTLPAHKERLRHTIFYGVEKMPEEEGATLLHTWLASANRSLQARQRREILNKFAFNGTPLYLKLAFERARTWHSYSPDYSLSPDTDGMLAKFFDQLEGDHGSFLVQKVCGYLLSGKYQGLMEQEILDLLVFDQGHWRSFVDRCHPDHRGEVEQMSKLPLVVWSRLYLDLEPYLAERDADGFGIISFYHRSFGVYAKRVGKLPHSTLADYYEGQPLYLQDSQRVPHVRKLVEQPYQLMISGERWEALEMALTDLKFVEAKCLAGMTYELVDDIEAALRGLPAVGTQEQKGSGQGRSGEAHTGFGDGLQKPPTNDYRRLKDLVEFLRRLRHRLDVYPYLCLQELANQPDSSSMSHDATRLLEEEKRPWMRWVNKRKETKGCLFSLAGDGHSIYSCAVSPDGRTLAAAGWDGIALWNLDTGKRLDNEPAITQPIRVIAFCGRGLWVGTRNRVGRIASMLLVEQEIWEIVHRWKIEADVIAFSTDSRFAAITQRDADSIEILDVDKEVPIRSLKLQDVGLQNVCGLSFASGSPSLAAVDTLGHVALWDTGTWEGRLSLSTDIQNASACVLSPDGSLMVVSHLIGLLCIDVATGQVLHVSREHFDQVEGGCFTPDASLFISCSRDGFLKAWRVSDWLASGPQSGGAVPKDFQDPWIGRLLVDDIGPEYYGIIASAITCEGSTVVFSVPMKGLLFCHLPGLEEQHSEYVEKQYHVTALACSPDGKTIAYGRTTGTVSVLGGHGDMHVHSYAVTACHFSSRGDFVLSSSFDGTMALSPLSGSGRTVRMQGHSSCVHDCAFSPDDRYIASASADGRIGLWSRSGRLIATFVDDGIAKHCCSFSADGSLLAWGTAFGRVHIYDVAKREELSLLDGHSAVVFHCSWSPDGTTLTTASHDGTIRIWSVPAKEQTALFVTDAPFATCTCSASGRLVFAGNYQGDRYLLELTRPL